MCANVFIDLSKDEILRQQQQRRIKETWEFQRGLGFYTIRNALCRVELLKGKTTGQKIISIRKGKQMLCLVPEDAKYLAQAIQRVVYNEKDIKVGG